MVSVPLPGCNLRRNAGSAPVGHWAVMAKKATPPVSQRMNGTHAHTDISKVVLVVAMAVTVTMAVTGHHYIGHYKNGNFNRFSDIVTTG